jgi:hypothetical protein
VQGYSARALLGRPVTLRGIELGRAIDIVLDLSAGRALAFEVQCGDGGRRFLPVHAARVVEDALRVSSPLAVLDEGDAVFYRRHGTNLRSVLGTPAGRDGGTRGVVDDVYLEDDLRVSRLIVAVGREQVALPFDDLLRFGGPLGNSA